MRSRLQRGETALQLHFSPVSASSLFRLNTGSDISCSSAVLFSSNVKYYRELRVGIIFQTSQHVIILILWHLPFINNIFTEVVTPPPPPPHCSLQAQKEASVSLPGRKRNTCGTTKIKMSICFFPFLLSFLWPMRKSFFYRML